MRLEIHAEPVQEKDLKVGDLFSPLGPEHWEQKVHLHECPCGRRHTVAAELFIVVKEEPEPESDTDVFLITFQKV